MNRTFYHVLFLALCAAVLVVLLRAPEVRTPRIPSDEIHAEPKQYKRCGRCHTDGEGPAMPPDHRTAPGEVRIDHLKCYFCHKPAR